MKLTHLSSAYVFIGEKEKQYSVIFKQNGITLIGDVYCDKELIGKKVFALGNPNKRNAIVAINDVTETIKLKQQEQSIA